MFEAFGKRFVLCGIADGETAGGNVSGDDGSRGDHGSGTDGDAFQNNGSGANEASFPDMNGAPLLRLSPGIPPSGAAQG